MLNGRKWLALIVVLALLISAIVFFNDDAPSPLARSDAKVETPMPTVPAPASEVDRAGELPQRSATTPLETRDNDVASNDGAFRVDTTGALVLDEQTRLNIEKLVASADPNDLYAETREQTENLPPAAARLAEELVNKFIFYQQAQRQIHPPDIAPSTEDDAVRQLEELHALRETHFGPDVARRFYGQEEVIAREMIEVMRLENDQSLTPQEKLARSHALRERLPGVAAIEKNNRDAAQKQEEEK